MYTYIVIIHTKSGFSFHMPYLFTSLKEAILYGEYNYRNYENTEYYEIEKLKKVTTFYKLR